MRLRTTKTDLNGTDSELTVENVFRSDAPTHVAMTYDFQQAIIYIDGQRRLQSSTPGGTFLNWDPSYNLALGNELTGNRPWHGQLFLVALYKRALSPQEIVQNYQAGIFVTSRDGIDNKRVADELVALYAFNESGGNIVKDHHVSKMSFDLFVLQELEITHKIFPTDYLRTHTKSGRDITLNILAFIPFGFCLHITTRKSCFPVYAVHLVIIGFGILFTFTIESAQFFLETRDSSMIDVLSNTIGIAGGSRTEYASARIV